MIFIDGAMILETYQMAKKRKDTKTMGKAATSYAKFNRIDIEDEQSVPYHMIVVQPFFPTTDPRVVGITYAKNIPNFYSLPGDWFLARWLLLFYAEVAQV